MGRGVGRQGKVGAATTASASWADVTAFKGGCHFHDQSPSATGVAVGQWVKSGSRPSPLHVS